jgi:hypothetical protein
VNGLNDVTAIAAGQNFSLALASDGAVWAWGDNSWGELGNGSVDAEPHTSAGRVPGAGGIGSIWAGTYATESFALSRAPQIAP